MHAQRPRIDRALVGQAALAAMFVLLARPAGCLAADEHAPACTIPAGSSADSLREARQLTAEIDRVLAASWAAAKIEPAAPADDAQFLRRIYLDLIGKIPSVAELQAFLANSAPDKRASVVEELLGRGAHAQHFANTWRGLMLAGAPENIESGLLIPQFETWLRLRFAVNTPYDRFVNELLTSAIEPAAQPTAQRVRSALPSPAAFFQANESKPEQIAASTTRIFLGVQVQCAQCHDHPFSHWTRREFWSLAAFFDRPPGMAAPAKPPSGSVNAILIPETQIVVEPAFLDGRQPDWSTGAAKRELLSRWITETSNPFFARAAVNRLWDHFLGRGFVHPVDDLDKSNHPSHPELLDEMARQFAVHHFDLNYLVRAITLTRAYQLSSQGGSAGDDDLSQFARMPLRRMTSDQLFASIVQATGFREPPRPARRGVVLPDTSSAAAEFRNRFADQSVPRTEAETSILQALALMNGQLVSDATDLAKSETLVAVAEAPFMDHLERVEALFMAALARRPAADELGPLVTYVEQGGAEHDSPKKALADVFWALLNSAEFALNH
ncbi:MAG TPA: DUF1549 and DUF1553 domain-containing protein [Pirellulales bacterium]|nr:DUF1549 and DUF1553 domain-containing protein [Pirellulales bacterium]